MESAPHAPSPGTPNRQRFSLDDLLTLTLSFYRQLMTSDDLPILGESLAIDLANTRYGSGEDTIDFLAHPALAALWLAHALPDATDATDAPSPMPSAEAAALGALRDGAGFDVEVIEERTDDDRLPRLIFVGRKVEDGRPR